MAQAGERRIPSLDGLRAISIGLVLLGHLAGTSGFPVSASQGNFWSLGGFGVGIFFVISGFLITGLLMDETARTGGIGLGRFYLRRTLRIFPPYYAYLLVIVIASIAGAVQLAPYDAAYTLTYTSNYYPERSWVAGHTWSLSVEEQFYLLWPAVLLLAGVRRGLWIAGAVVLLVPVIRLIEWNFVPSAASGIGHRFETVADAIAVGCVLAGVRGFLHRQPLYLRALSSPWFLLVPIAAIGGNLLHDRPQISFAVGMSITHIAVALCIDWAVTFHQGRIGRILNSAPLVFVGWMSYSLYLWQQPFLNRASDAAFAAFPLNILLALLAAVASYFLIERPSLRLRKRIEDKFFRHPPVPAPEPTPVAVPAPLATATPAPAAPAVPVG